jgi:hypothetical protein
MTSAATVLVERSEWETVRRKTIFFGHQSIDNIIDGLGQIASAKDWPALNIIETNGGVSQKEAALFHAKVGHNGDPASKMRGFRDALDAGVGSHVDVALMKFCFWDIRRDSDVDTVFSAYTAMMDDLSRRFQHVTFMHATVPLSVADRDWRARTKRWLGMMTSWDADNAARESLNNRLRQRYGQQGIVFDIAAAERDGSMTHSNVPHLADALSSDGAHLNDEGRQRVAHSFVRSLMLAAERHESMTPGDSGS